MACARFLFAFALTLSGLAGCLDEPASASHVDVGEAVGAGGPSPVVILSKAISGPGEAAVEVPEGTVRVQLSLEVDGVLLLPQLELTGCPDRVNPNVNIQVAVVGTSTYERSCSGPAAGEATVAWGSALPVMPGTVTATAYVAA